MTNFLLNLLAEVFVWVVGWMGSENNSWWSWIAVTIFAVPFLVMAGGAFWSGVPWAGLFFACIGLGVFVVKVLIIRRARSG